MDMYLNVAGQGSVRDRLSLSQVQAETPLHFSCITLVASKESGHFEDRHCLSFFNGQQLKVCFNQGSAPGGAARPGNFKTGFSEPGNSQPGSGLTIPSPEGFSPTQN